MRFVYNILVIPMSVLILCFGISCSNDRQSQLLLKAESLMEQHPDSSLRLLEKIENSDLRSQEQRASYSLLMSIALDKNYIDTVTFDVIRPAVDYYLKKDVSDERIKTYYYQGRIFQNGGDRENALYSYEKALADLQQYGDSMMLVRTLVAMASVHYEFHDFELYTFLNLRAADICNRISRYDNEFSCILNALDGAIITNKKELADSLIATCRANKLSDRQEALLSGRILPYVAKFRTKNELYSFLSNGLQLPKLSVNNTLDLASAYNKLGDNDKAKKLLDSVIIQRESFDTLKYQSIYVSVLKDLGNYQGALSVYEDLGRRLDDVNSRKFHRKIRSIIEKCQYDIETQNTLREKSKILWGCTVGIIVLVMSLVILILIIRNNDIKRRLALQRAKAAELENKQLKSEKECFALENANLLLEKERKALEAENLAHRVENLENESENLRRIISKTKEELPSEVRKTIQERISMLNSLLAGYITSNEKYVESYESWVRSHTENIEDFMNSTRMAFSVTHPQFIQYFENHGLTLSEINYVCLYAIGLRGKEVGNYIKKRSHVNISSVIRKKLGIDKHDTNIGIYVRKLLRVL